MQLRTTLCLALAAASVSCATPMDPIERGPVRRPQVVRDDEVVEIRWPTSFTAEAVTVYAGSAPDAIRRDRPIRVTAGNSVRLREEDGLDEVANGGRLYFELVPTRGGTPAVTSERRLPLECCDNFRDLGGYETRDGRMVRWNRLYRANDLSKLSETDLRYVSGLGIKLVCDFRSPRERAAKPDREMGPNEPARLDLPVTQEGVDPEEMQRKIRTGGVAALGTEATMLAAYRAFVTDYADEWSAMFERISREANLPAVVHCTAGKDRTGFASALVLMALGVPQETVFEDYLLTNYYQQNFFRFVLRWVPLYSLFRTDAEALIPLLTARRPYLQASIDMMTERHGSVDEYLETVLGVTPELRTRLRASLLE